MNKNVFFNPQGGYLWVEMHMGGLYRIVYDYDLWSNQNNKPVIISKETFSGHNEDENHNDFTEVQNDFDPNEPLHEMDGYELATSFKIIKKGKQ